MSKKKVEYKLTRGAQRVLDYIKENGSITSLEAFKKLGETRLSARIFELRKYVDVEGVWTSVKNRHGETCHVLKYYLG